MKPLFLSLLLILLFVPDVYCQSEDDLFHQADVAISKEQYDKAEKIYKQLTRKLSPTSPNLFVAYMNMALSQRRNGKMKEALESYNVAEELSPNNPSVLNDRASLKSNLKDYKGAADDYSKSIKADSTLENSYLGRSVMYKKMKDTIAAVADLKYILEKINSKSLPARNNFADVLMSQGQLTEAMAIFDELLSEKPNEPILLQNKGEVYFKQKDYKNALEYINKALKINPKYGNAYVTRGEVYLEQGNLKKAKSDFQKAIELKCSNDKVFSLLDRCQ